MADSDVLSRSTASAILKKGQEMPTRHRDGPVGTPCLAGGGKAGVKKISVQFDGTFSGTLYEEMGGADALARLVHEFYSRVPEDPILSPIFPDDLSETERKQFAFLTQFFGGSPLFSATYGPPRLRARHLPFPITPRRARAWLALMDTAMDEAGIDSAVKVKLMERLTRTAVHMINTEEDDEPTNEPGA